MIIVDALLLILQMITVLWLYIWYVFLPPTHITKWVLAPFLCMVCVLSASWIDLHVII